MSRWLHEHDFDTIVADVAAANGVEPELVLAVIAKESQFNPNAYRAEPSINDASRGLMQLLASTARGLGWGGNESELFEPRRNIELGTMLLADLLGQTGSTADALSAYNGGLRPLDGFGRVAPTGGLVVHHRDGSITTTAAGQYTNQAYVDSVLGYRDYFRSQPPVKTSAQLGQVEAGGVSPTPPGIGSPELLLYLVLAIGGVAIVWLATAR